MTERIQILKNTLGEDQLAMVIPTSEEMYQDLQGDIPNDASSEKNRSTLTALYNGWLSIIRTKAEVLKIDYQLYKAERRQAAAPEPATDINDKPAKFSEAWFLQQMEQARSQWN